MAEDRMVVVWECRPKKYTHTHTARKRWTRFWSIDVVDTVIFNPKICSFHRRFFLFVLVAIPNAPKIIINLPSIVFLCRIGVWFTHATMVFFISTSFSRQCYGKKVVKNIAQLNLPQFESKCFSVFFFFFFIVRLVPCLHMSSCVCVCGKTIDHDFYFYISLAS